MPIVKDPKSENPYLRQGFKDRTAYLRSVAEDYDVPLKHVRILAELLGPDEDFDGLLVSLPDTL